LRFGSDLYGLSGLNPIRGNDYIKPGEAQAEASPDDDVNRLPYADPGMGRNQLTLGPGANRHADLVKAMASTRRLSAGKGQLAELAKPIRWCHVLLGDAAIEKPFGNFGKKWVIVDFDSHILFPDIRVLFPSSTSFSP
jgi:hypothetical protein